MPYHTVNQLNANASMGAWLDSASSGVSYPSGSTAPTRTTFTTNTAGWIYAIGDYFDGFIQMNHDVQKSSPLDIHIHFAFGSQPSAGTNLAWQLYYCYAKLDGTFSETAATAVEYTVQASDNKVHRVFEIGSITADATAPQSSGIIVRVMRVAKLTGTECDVSPTVWAVDAHYKSRIAGGTVVELGP
jgi:hypothetical protein